MRFVLIFSLLWSICHSLAAQSLTIKIFEEKDYSKTETVLTELTIENAKQFDFSKLKSPAASLVTLRINADNIHNFDLISNYRNLKFLSISNSDLETLHPLKELHNLQFLSLSNNRIKEIDSISGLPKLETLFLDWNKIARLDGRFPKLKSISLNSNQANSICDFNAPNLEKFVANNNMIKDITCLKDWKNLKIVKLKKNPIESFPTSLNTLNQLELDKELLSDKHSVFSKFQDKNPSLLLPYSLFLLVLIAFWFTIRSRISFDIYLLLMIIPSVIYLGIVIAFEYSVTYKFELYQIIWFQCLIACLISIRYYLNTKNKLSLVVSLPLFIFASIFMLWIGGIVSSISLL